MAEKSTFTILHHLELEASPAAVFEAVATREGVAAWWSPMTTGSAEVGGILQVRFGDGKFGPDMQVEISESPSEVRWLCVEGPWKGSHFSFHIAPHERGSQLTFKHEDWPAQDDFFGHCNAKWGYFLVSSLKPFVETGKGRPHPEDPKF